MIPQISTRPFTEHDIARYNHPWRMTTTTLERENQQFEQACAEEQEIATTHLRRYGIEQIPADVERALQKLRLARYLLWRWTTNATAKAPGAMVVGPSGYNQRHHERVWRAENKRYDAIERARRLLARAIGRYAPNRPISSDAPDAIQQLEAKIIRAEELHAKMKTANRICQSKKIPLEQKQEQLKAIGYERFKITELLNPRYSFEQLGHQGWELQNNSTNIRRMKDRVAELKQKQLDIETVVECGGIRIVDNVADNRLQIFFPDKPSTDTRTALKRSGFRWTPTVGCWQRQRSETANQLARQITGINIKSKEPND